MRVHLSVDHYYVNVFICMLNFCGCSQPQNHFNSEISLVYSIDYLLQTAASRLSSPGQMLKLLGPPIN